MESATAHDDGLRRVLIIELRVVRFVLHVAAGRIVLFDVAVAVEQVEQGDVGLDPLSDPAAQVADALPVGIGRAVEIIPSGNVLISAPHRSDGLRDRSNLW
ncbi:hypothetical protein [Methylobacterium aerolatum]|uniref:Uncharacterized protein n=1 Tax=Methylobacterium aerolatum TaxID=418708 RepID=A0ABU0I5D7_9HYPH|nr:hypothetical protein [Methylobacterium aerolatum]MDQ0449837.1 hypothetical protein [Methylobacterium aerolatum]